MLLNLIQTTHKFPSNQLDHAKWNINIPKRPCGQRRYRRICRTVAVDYHALDRSPVTPQPLAMHVWETQCKQRIWKITLMNRLRDDPWPVLIPCFRQHCSIRSFCFVVFEAKEQTQRNNLSALPSQAQWQRDQHNFHPHTNGFESMFDFSISWCRIGGEHLQADWDRFR